MRSKVLWVARYDYQPCWKLKNHEHEYYQMIYIIDGMGKMFLGSEELIIKPNKLFFIKPMLTHGLVACAGSSLKTLDIKFTISDTELAQELSKLPEEFFIKDSKARKILESIRQEGMEKSCFYKDFSGIYLEELLLFLMRIHRMSSEGLSNSLEEEEEIQDSLSSRVKEYVKDNYSKPIKLDMIAEELRYNKTYLCEAFKKSNNLTLMDYIYIYRIERAKELIEYSDYSLKEISSMTGFQSIHHFTRLFKQREKLTPGQWRNREREGIRKDIYISDDFINRINTEEGNE